jgi:hypothetical protein
MIHFSYLAAMTSLDMIRDILVHARPEIVHRDPSLGFTQSIMPGKKLTVGFL